MKYTTVTIPFIAMGLICSLLFLGIVPVVFAQQISRVVAVSVGDVNGTVEILSREDAKRQQGKTQILGEPWKPAASKTSIRVGDQLRTGVDSSLTLHLNDGTVFTLSGDSMMVVEDLKSAQGSSPRTATFLLDHGTISTKQTTRILGQTVQVIRTENGSVDARMGEVEVYKPQQKYTKLAAALPYQWPLLVQASESDNNKTFVRLNTGALTARAKGDGSMVTMSQLLPETCVGDDGVLFILDTAGAEVQLSKLVERNGFHFKANRPVHVLTVTEDQATGITIRNISGDAKTDIEGISIAEQGENSALRLGVKSLVTVGVTATDAEVHFSCREEEPESLYQIYGTDGNVVLLGVAPGRDSRLASRGYLTEDSPTPTPVPGTPTPTPTPEPDATPTPTPTPTEIARPLPPPLPTVQPPVPPSSPVTHTFNQRPWFTSITASSSASSGADGCQVGEHKVVVSAADFFNFLPTISGGRLRSRITDSSGVPVGDVAGYSINDYLTYYLYTGPHQEEGTVSYAFCYNDFFGGTVYFDLRIWDSYGNPSQSLAECQGTLATGIVNCTF